MKRGPPSMEGGILFLRGVGAVGGGRCHLVAVDGKDLKMFMNVMDNLPLLSMS